MEPRHGGNRDIYVIWLKSSTYLNCDVPNYCEETSIYMDAFISMLKQQRLFDIITSDLEDSSKSR